MFSKAELDLIEHEVRRRTTTREGQTRLMELKIMYRGLLGGREIEEMAAENWSRMELGEEVKLQLRRENVVYEAQRRFKTRFGFRVRSKAEKIIADFYNDCGINVIYEPPVLLYLGLLPDFYVVGGGVFHEHFGMDSNEKYRVVMRDKLGLYNANRVRLICTVSKDEENIEDVLRVKLGKAGVMV